MMGFGPYGAGGNGGSYLSPTSSNLSASAPPFTIDRSGPKPASCPLVDLTEPSYPGPMNSSLHNWLPSLSPTSDPKFFSNHQLELNSGSSSNAYGYGALHTAESSNLNTHFSHLSPTVSASVDGFSYGQSSDSGATGFVEAKPYYPSYLSPAAHKDGGLGIHDQTSYDWLSDSSRVTALDGSSNNDYSLKFSDSKYAGNWGGMWNGFAEWKQGKQGQVDGGLCSKDSDVPVLSIYENYMNQESPIPKGLNRGEEASHGINILDSEKHSESVNTEKMNDQSFSGKTSNLIPAEYSRPIFGSLSGLPDTHLESPSFIFGKSSGNHQIPYGGSNEKRLKQHANNSTSIVKSSPGLVIAPPAAGSGSSAPNNVLFKTFNLGSNSNDTDVSGKKACGIKDSHSQLSSEHNLVFDSSQLSIHLERDDPISLISFPRRKEETLNKECITDDTLHHMLKVKSGLQTSNVSHDGFNVDLNVNESINVVENSSECVDHYNPAVDSPCWKGVPVTRSSPFDASEVVPEMRKLEVCSKSNIQARQIFPLKTGDKVSSQKPNENITYHQFGYSENGSEFPLNISSVTNSAFGEQKLDNSERVGYQSETKNSGDSDENGSRSMGCSDLKTSQITKQNIRGDGLTAKNVNEPMQYISSHLPFPVEHVVSPSVGDASPRLTKSNEGPSTPTLDALMLNSEKMVPIQGSTSSENDTSDYPRELNDLHKGVTKDSPELTKTVGLKALFDSQNVHKGNSYYLSGQRDDEILDSVSVRGDMDMVDEGYSSCFLLPEEKEEIFCVSILYDDK
ncbi:hypothetical protein TorRG33x02_205010 [Trema orientale]|uniref:Uncharacterized protein n=1 Tax=Trema orientale TaxID=63057 RepID=A0A2P5EDT6_TREOI|nr:hypothetical protein TorRG33x02_205010 [Trema orientale]